MSLQLPAIAELFSVFLVFAEFCCLSLCVCACLIIVDLDAYCTGASELRLLLARNILLKISEGCWSMFIHFLFLLCSARI